MVKESAKKEDKDVDGPKNVWAMGITSLLTDISSEMIFPILPLFLKIVLKANMAIIGLIEGIAEVTSALLKYLSGYMSDRLKVRKWMAFAGYGVSTTVKPVLAIATSWTHVLFVRFTDRVGKGIRTSPRDALIAASVDKKERGKYFGLHRTLDTVGAIIGTLLVVALLHFLGSSEQAFRTIFWISIIPAVLALIVLGFMVKEVKGEKTKTKVLNLKWKNLNASFKKFLIVTLLFGMANFSYAFFILRAEDIGASIAIIPLLYLVHNFFYAGISTPVGILGDRIGKKNILAFGYLLFALVAFAFSQVSIIWLLWILFAFYGVFMGINDGLSKAYVADLSKKGEEGRSQGAYGMFAGIVTLPANALGGLIWDSFGVQYTFYYAAILSGIAAILLYFLIEEEGKDKRKGEIKAEKFRFYR